MDRELADLAREFARAWMEDDAESLLETARQIVRAVQDEERLDGDVITRG